VGGNVASECVCGGKAGRQEGMAATQQAPEQTGKPVRGTPNARGTMLQRAVMEMDGRTGTRRVRHAARVKTETSTSVPTVVCRPASAQPTGSRRRVVVGIESQTSLPLQNHVRSPVNNAHKYQTEGSAYVHVFGAARQAPVEVPRKGRLKVRGVASIPRHAES